MINGTLYIKFGKNGTYFQIDTESIEPFSTELIDDMPVVRKKWGEVLIKNYPYKYKSSQIDKNMLYDIIMEQEPDTEIYVKYIAENGTETEGYFGIIDCEINDNKKFIKVTPTIYDQYTYLLEYYEDDVELFKDENLLYNGNMDSWSEGYPESWNFSEGDESSAISSTTIQSLTYSIPNSWGQISNNIPLKPELDTINDLKTCVLPCRIVCNLWNLNNGFTGYYTAYKQKSFIYQDIENIQSGRDIKISFFYALLEQQNEDLLRQNLSLAISLTDGVTTKYIGADGLWGDTASLFVYKTDILPIPVDDVNLFHHGLKILKPAPLTGTLRIYFINDISVTNENVSGNLVDDNDSIPQVKNIYYSSKLALSKISIESSDVKYTAVKINLASTNLMKREQSGINDSNGFPYATYFREHVKHSDIRDLINYGTENDGYFDNVTGAPNWVVLDSSKHGPHNHDTGSMSEIQYPDLWVPDDITTNYIFNDPDSDFYMGELYQLTIYKSYSHIKGIAVYAREEIRSNDLYTEEDYDNGYCTLPQVGVDYRPPAQDAGWVSTTRDKSLGGMLWVRKPFNGAYSPDVDTEGNSNWIIGEIDSSGGHHGYGFDWSSKVTSTRNYPIGDNSISYDACVDLRGIIKRAYCGTHNSLIKKEVYSTFLWNDLPNDSKTAALLDAMPLLSSGINYVTGADNYLNRIVALQTYQLQTSKSDDDDGASLTVSFKSLMSDLQVIFPDLYYFVDDNGDLHVEHKKYEDLINYAVDITSQIKNYQSWKFDNSDMYATITYKPANSGYSDFAYSKVLFDKIVSNKRAKDIRKEYSTDYLTTDLQYCMENPDDIDDGLILINYEINSDGDKVISYASGQRSGYSVLNGILSIANMLKTFGTWEGVWESGIINNEQVIFKVTKRTKKGVDTINLKGIYENNYFITDLGIGFGTKKIDYEKNVTQLTLNYRYSEWYLVVEDGNLFDF